MDSIEFLNFAQKIIKIVCSTSFAKVPFHKKRETINQPHKLGLSKFAGQFEPVNLDAFERFLAAELGENLD